MNLRIHKRSYNKSLNRRFLESLMDIEYSDNMDKNMVQESLNIDTILDADKYNTLDDSSAFNSENLDILVDVVDYNGTEEVLNDTVDAANKKLTPEDNLNYINFEEDSYHGKNKKKIFLESIYGTPYSLASLIREYIKAGGRQDYEEWADFLKLTHNIDVYSTISSDEELKVDKIRFRNYYKDHYKRINNKDYNTSDTSMNTTTISGTNSSRNWQSNQESEEERREKLSKTSLDILDEIGDVSTPLSAAEIVEEKYATIVKRLKDIIHKKSSKNYFILFGDPGIGKSFIVNEVFQRELGVNLNTKNEEELSSRGILKAVGDVGKSRSSAAEFLYVNRDKDFIILDDCDSLIMNTTDPAVSNMLKGAMDPDHHTVTVDPGIAILVNKRILERAEAENKLAKLQNKRKGNSSDTKGDESSLNEETWTDFLRPENNIDKEDSADTKGDEQSLDTENNESIDENDNIDFMPLKFSFEKPRVIFISNATPKNINEALLSRSSHFYLHLTFEEFIIRLKLVLDKLKKRGGYTDEEWNEAKVVVFDILVTMAETQKNGLKFGGITLKFSRGFEFRLVEELATLWLQRVERYLDENPGSTREDARRKCFRKYIIYDVLKTI